MIVNTIGLQRTRSVGKPPAPPSLLSLALAISNATQQPTSVVASLLPIESPYVELIKNDPENPIVMAEVKAMSAEKTGVSVNLPVKTENHYEVPQKDPLSIRKNFLGEQAVKELKSNPSLPFILYNKDGKTKVAYRDGDSIKSKAVSTEITSGNGEAVFSSKGFSALPQSVRADLVKASGREIVPCGKNSNTVCDANGQLIEIPRNHVSGELPVITMTTENRLALSKTLHLEKGDVAVFVARNESGKEQTVGVFKYSDANGDLKTKIVPLPIEVDKLPKEVRANFVSVMDALDPPENAPAPPPRASLNPQEQGSSEKVNLASFANRVTSDIGPTSTGKAKIPFKDDPNKLFVFTTKKEPGKDPIPVLRYKIDGKVMPSIPLETAGTLSYEQMNSLPKNVQDAINGYIDVTTDSIYQNVARLESPYGNTGFPSGG